MTKDLTEGLILDLDVKNLKDYSGGTVTNYASTVANDKDGIPQGRDFNSQYFEIASVTGIKSHAMWLKSDIDVNASSVGNWVWQHNSASVQNFFRLGNTSGAVNEQVYYSTGSSISYYWDVTAIGGTPIGLLWHHYVIIWSSADSNYRLVYDGIDRGLATKSGSPTEVTTWSPLKMGKWSGSAYYDGKLGSTLKAWNRSLEVVEAQQLYNDQKHNYQGLFDGLLMGFDMKGDCKDYSGNGYDATVNGTTDVVDQFGKEDSAKSFNGTTSDHILVTSTTPFATDDPFTWASWVKPDVINDSYMRIVDMAKGDVGFWMGMNNVGNKFRVWNYDGSGSTVDSLAVVTAGTWYHVVATFDGTDLELYQDGVSQGSVTRGYTQTGTTPIRFGTYSDGSGNPSGSSDYWEGDIRDIKCYTRALSSSEVKALYQIESSGDIYPYPQERIGGITQ